MGPKKLQIEEKSRASTLLEKGDSVCTLVKDIGASKEAINQLKRVRIRISLINSLLWDTNIFR